MLTATNGAIEIAYETVGPTDGEPLLLICGASTQMIHWPDEFVDALVERGFRVARFDNRDSGHSTHRSDRPPYDLRDMADDAVAVLDALGWRTAHVLGVSLGGMIGQVMAVHHADRVATLTSMASTPFWSIRLIRPRLRTLIKIIGVQSRGRKGRDGTIETWVRLFRLMGTPRYRVDEGWIRDVTGRAYDIAHDPTADRRQLAACNAAGDRRAELAQVRAPTLVVHGEADPLQSVRAGRATAAANPGAELLTFPDVGHGLTPEQLWPRLFEALNDLRARTPS